jgi:hypothetical protein
VAANACYTIWRMAQKRPTLIQTAFRLPADIIDAMTLVRERDGTLQSEQARRALRDWLTKRRALKRAPTNEKHR